MLKFGIKVPHLRCDSHTSFKVKRSKVKVTNRRGHTLSAKRGGTRLVIKQLTNLGQTFKNLIFKPCLQSLCFRQWIEVRIIYVYVLLFSTLFTDFFGNRRYPLETSPPTPSGDYPLEKIARSNPHGSIRVMTQPSGSDRFSQEYGLVPVFKFSLEEYYYTPQADTFVEFCLGGNLREDVSRGGELSQSIIDKVVCQWRKRLRASIEAKWHHLEHLLN